MKTILIIILITISSVAFGQKHLVGIQGGLNITNFTSTEGFGNKSARTGFLGGITYDYLLTEKYRVEVDILYDQRGVVSKFFFTNDEGVYLGDEETKMSYDYLNVPIKFGYEVGNSTRLIPKIGIEPAFAIKAEINNPTFDESGKVTGKESIDSKDYVSKFDFGGLAELGIETDLSEKIILSSNVNYKHSFTKFSNSKSDYFETLNMRHYGFSIAVGLKYMISD